MKESQGFEEMLRQALNHLYQPEFLRQSPLIAIFSLENSDNPAAALRTTLEEAIEVLRPPSDVPANAKSRRYYELLCHRYVQRLTQQDVANRLGITPRHLRREQSGAIRALASHLLLRFDLLDQPSLTAIETGENDVSAMIRTELNREMRWLGDSLADQLTEVEPVLREAAQLANRLARVSGMSLDLKLDDPLPPVAAARTVLKQIVLNLAAAAVHSAPGGRMLLAATAQPHNVVISLACEASPGKPWHHQDWDGESVSVSQRLVKLFDGELQVVIQERAATARISIPRGDRVLVLAVEDNQDTLQLWQRFVRNTRFTLESTREPEQALAKAAELRPDMIILDVMLPDIDGWELLAQLRQHPATAAIPVLVCTVLPQQELARSLGASGFIRKPVTGRQFRAELERQIEAARRR